jgi:hypothetical protein
MEQNLRIQPANPEGWLFFFVVFRIQMKKLPIPRTLHHSVHILLYHASVSNIIIFPD